MTTVPMPENEGEMIPVPPKTIKDDTLHQCFTSLEKATAIDAHECPPEYFMNLLNMFPNPIWHANSTGECDFVNHAWLAVTGRTFEQELGDGWTIGIHPDDRDRCLNTILDALNRRESVALEYRLRCHDGTYRWINDYGKPHFDEKGSFLGYMGSCYDIHDRRQAEEALRETERRLTTLIDNLPGYVYRVKNDPHYTPDYISEGVYLVTGYQQQEYLLEHSICCGKEIHPEDVGPVWDTVQAAVKRKQPYECTYRVITKAGIEKWVWERGRGIFSETGDLLALEGFVTDISGLRSAEENLRASEERFALFMRFLPGPAFIKDEESRYVYLSDHFEPLFDIQLTDWLGKGPEEIWPADVARQLREHDALVLQKGVPVQFEEEIPQKGERHIYLTFKFPIKRPGKPPLLGGVAMDITERKQAEEERRHLQKQLMQSQKLESLGTLAGGIAHDFNNILHVIMGYSSLLERPAQSPTGDSEALKAIVGATERGAALVKQLLTLARQTPTLIEPLLINSEVEAIVKLMKETFPKTIDLHSDLADNLPIIEADSTQVYQVLLNLCVNARDAMPQGGTLAISTRLIAQNEVCSLFPNAAAQEYVEIKVADSGTGIDHANIDRIFEPFFTTKELGKGTGLGLALVHSIIEAHHGFIHPQSTSGKGTVFRIFFPVPVREVKEGGQKQGGVRDVPGGTETILVVEDEEMLRGLLRSFLESSGYTVLMAGNGEEAVEVYSRRQSEISAVISDMGLPRFGGNEVVKKLKAINPQVRVIIASGYIEPAAKKMLDDAGVTQIIQKPFRHKELLRGLREVLDGKT